MTRNQTRIQSPENRAVRQSFDMETPVCHIEHPAFGPVQCVVLAPHRMRQITPRAISRHCLIETPGNEDAFACASTRKRHELLTALMPVVALALTNWS